MKSGGRKAILTERYVGRICIRVREHGRRIAQAFAGSRIEREDRTRRPTNNCIPKNTIKALTTGKRTHSIQVEIPFITITSGLGGAFAGTGEQENGPIWTSAADPKMVSCLYFPIRKVSCHPE